jgi:predicted transposase YdaD
MTRLADRNPQHPLPKLLSPIFEKSDAKLESDAKVIYAGLKKSPGSSRAQSQTLCAVFYALLLSRFKNKTHQELSAMIILPDITKTRAGRELIEMGEARGKVEGKAEFACKVLTRRLGKLPKVIFEKIRHLDYLQLEKLADLVLDFADLKALKDWLLRL